MGDVAYTAWLEYSDGTIGVVGDGFVSADEAERFARKRLDSVVVTRHIEQEHGGVKAVVIRESREVRRIEL